MATSAITIAAMLAAGIPVQARDASEERELARAHASPDLAVLRARRAARELGIATASRRPAARRQTPTATRATRSVAESWSPIRLHPGEQLRTLDEGHPGRARFVSPDDPAVRHLVEVAA